MAATEQTSPPPNANGQPGNGAPDPAGVETWLVVTTLVFTALLIAWSIAALVAKSGLTGIDDVLTGEFVRMDRFGTIMPTGRLETIARDVSGLGSDTVLMLVVLFALGLLSTLGRAGSATFVVVTFLSGWIFTTLLKILFDRPRPGMPSLTIAPETSSFPSSHALLSAVVFLSLAVIVAREFKSQAPAAIVLSAAIFATVIVGLSRLYLGAHWPSDVLTGWTLGSAFVLSAMRLSASPRPPD